MKCPVCVGRKEVEIDMHSEGFSGAQFPLKECGACGAIWRIKMVNDKPEIDIIRKGEKGK